MGVYKKGKSKLSQIFGIANIRHCAHTPKSYKLCFNDGMFENIMKLKGWRNNADAAKETGYTRQYVSMVRRGVVSVTTDFLVRTLELTGNIDNPRWSEMFKIIPRGEYNLNHQLWNDGKYKGRIAYRKHSLAAEVRSKDNVIEQEN